MWNGQTVFDASVDGVAQETCRDLTHTQYGISATFAAAETAFLQGIDLITGDMQARLVATVELHAGFLEDVPPLPAICQGKKLSRPTALPIFEIAYNNLHNRKNIELPSTIKHLKKTIRRLTGMGMFDQHLVTYETLTHASWVTADKNAADTDPLGLKEFGSLPAGGGGKPPKAPKAAKVPKAAAVPEPQPAQPAKAKAKVAKVAKGAAQATEASTTTENSASTTTTNEDDGSHQRVIGLAVGIPLGVVFLVLVIGLTVFFIQKRKPAERF